MAKLLLISADELLAKAYRVRLRREGFEVEHCHTGQAGLARAHQWSPDCILLDLALSGMHGLDVLKSLRDVPWVLKAHVVLLIDRTLTPEVLDECLFWGADSFLHKDVCSLQDMLEHVNRVLDCKLQASSRKIQAVGA
jgi:DNA-binding response OmpR family regulator